LSNKLRTIAIIITVALACVMIFFSFIYENIILEQFRNNVTVESQNTDIRIQYSEKSDSKIISKTYLNALDDEIDFAVGVLNLYGTSTIDNEVTYINLRGIEEAGLYKLNDIEYIESIGRGLREDEVIISEKTSIALNLSMDSSIKIKIGDIQKTFYVAKIAKDHDCFEEAGCYVFYGVETYVSKFITGGGFGNIYNKIYVKIASDADIDDVIYDISQIDEYKDYLIKKEFDTTKIDTESKEIAMPVTIATYGCAVLALILIYIIFSSGIAKRTMLISQLKSIGISFGQLISIFMIECILYIIVGLSIGIGLNMLLIKIYVPKLIDIDVASVFYLNNMIYSALICAGLVLILDIYPIIKASRKSIRDSYVSSKKSIWKGNYFVLVFSIILIITAIILMLPHYFDSTRGIIAFTFFMVGVILVVPYLMKGIATLLLKLPNKSVMFNALKNIRQEKVIVNNNRILIAGMLVCIIMGSTSIVTANICEQYINSVDCDIVIENIYGDTESQLNTIKSTDGVYDVRAYQYEKIDLVYKECDYIINIIGIQPEDVGILEITEDISTKQEITSLLESGDGMLIDYMYHMVYKINIGDVIPITINDITKDITIIGYYNSYDYVGRTALINSDLLSELFEVSKYNKVICNTYNDVDTTVSELRVALGASNTVVLNKVSMNETYFEVFDETITFVYYFVLAVFIVILISIITNILNSREERKTFIYQMYSLGFSRVHLMLIELVENSISGVILSVISFLSLFVLDEILCNIVSISKLYVVSCISYNVVILCIVISVAFYILIALTAIFTVKRKNIVNNIKMS
jgi:ABC-type antimicrobial peptide transport system permease subunit